MQVDVPSAHFFVHPECPPLVCKSDPQTLLTWSRVSVVIASASPAQRTRPVRPRMKTAYLCIESLPLRYRFNQRPINMVGFAAGATFGRLAPAFAAPVSTPEPAEFIPAVLWRR